jgi:hypothetical protein
MTTPPLTVKIHREGNLIMLDSLAASVTFYPKNKDRTQDAIIEACCLREKAYQAGSEQLRQLQLDIDEQLTTIYQQYHKEKTQKKNNGGDRPAWAKQEEDKSKQQEEEKNIIKLDVSFEDWQRRLAWHYNNLKATTESHFPDAVWPSLEFVLSVTRILHVKDITLPWMGIILGKPSSYKTFAIELLRGTPNTLYTDSFTAKSFVSHNGGVSEEELAEIDLLPKLKNRI